jgi:hypothetical protein
MTLPLGFMQVWRSSTACRAAKKLAQMRRRAFCTEAWNEVGGVQRAAVLAIPADRYQHGAMPNHRC